MSEEKGTVLTESGLKKLQEKLDYLISVRRNEISEQIAIARGFGDLSENAEYDEAKKEQAKVEEEITRLQATIRTATVVADDEITTERVSIGTIVKVKDLDENERMNTRSSARMKRIPQQTGFRMKALSEPGFSGPKGIRPFPF